MRHPGDRRRIWKQTCEIQGGIGFLIAAGLVLAAVSATKGGAVLGVMAAGIALMSLTEFRSAKRGWKLKDGPSPRYYRDIKSRDPVRRQMAEEILRAVQGEVKDPNHTRYAFEEQEDGKD